MTMADRIVVMHDGVVEQIGAPLELYDHPDNLFVAQFIGSPAMNVLNGTLRRNGGEAAVETPDGVRWPVAQNTGGADGQPVAYGVRPEHLSLSHGIGAEVPAEIVVVEPTGAETEFIAKAGASQITFISHGRPQVNPGDRISLGIEANAVHLFDQKTGQRLNG